VKVPNTPVVLTLDHLEEEVDYFMSKDAFAFDVEAWGEHRGVPSHNTLNWMSLATDGRAFVVPFGHPNGSQLISRATKKLNKVTNTFTNIPAVYDDPPQQLLPSEVFSTLKPLFFSDRTKVAFNATYDLISTAKYFGEIAPGPYGDPIVMQWLLNENLPQKGLKHLTKMYYGVEYDDEQVGKCVEAFPFNTVAHYALMDAKFTWFLFQKFLPMLKDEDLMKVYDLEMGVLGSLLSMGVTGAPVDVSAVEDLRDDLSEQVVELEANIYRAAGKVFNVNSNPQKQKILFGPKDEGGQGLRPKKMTAGGAPSTDAETLEQFPTNPVAKAMIAYAEVNKLLTTYVIGYLGDPEEKKEGAIFNGRIHADFVQYGTVTGRFSCREPNLQNIPRPDTELGNKIRGLFIAPPGHKLVVADYAQIEMVILAHFTGAGRLFEDLHAGVDPHTATAAGVFKVPVSEVTKPMRQMAKGINFAVVYGAGPAKVASMAGTSETEAKKFLKIHQQQFPEIYRLKDAIIQRCKSRKPAHITTIFGRKRRLPTIFANNFGVRGKAERQAVNSLIQGSAADLIKYAMVRLHAALPPDMKLILSVHDELVVICPDDRTDECVGIMREAMLGEGIASLLKTPIASDVKVADRWSEAK